MIEHRENLIAAHQSGRLLETALESTFGSNENRSYITEALVALHNEGVVDIIEEFKSLRNNKGSGPNFFRARRLLENFLPRLNAPIQHVMECVAKLAEEAGQDMAANTIFTPFADFCAADLSRPVEGLKLIKESPRLWAGFACPIIVAGTRIDMSRFFEEAVTLTFHEDIGVRKNAIFSLGRIQFLQNSELTELALKRLDNMVDQETDDHLLGNIVNSSCSIFRQRKSLADQTVKILDAALSKGQDYTLHAASEEFGFNSDELTMPMLLVIMSNLMRINPSNKGTVDNVDFGVAKLIEKGSQDQGIEFLENLLLAHPRDLSLESFDSVVDHILSSGTCLLNKLFTRWFLRGDRVLCAGIPVVLGKVHGKEIYLEVDPLELPSSDPIKLRFIGRKAIGYLFSTPITAASIIISLMQQTDDSESVKVIASLLFDPLLLNYSCSLREFLEARVSSEVGQTKDAIQVALDDLAIYFEELKSIGKLPEMYPSQDQRESHSRHFNQQMSESYKEAMKGSFINLICSKTVLLYGRKSINYIYKSSGEAERMEIPLQSYGTEIEFPRREHIDPFGLDYMLRLFRGERLEKS